MGKILPKKQSHLSLLILILFLHVAPLKAIEVIEQTVAYVDQTVINLSDLKLRALILHLEKKTIEKMQNELSLKDLDQLRDQVIQEELIDRYLLKLDRRYDFEQSLLDETMRNFSTQVNSEQELSSMVQAIGFEKKDFDLALQKSWQRVKFLSDEFYFPKSVSEEEIYEYYQEKADIYAEKPIKQVRNEIKRKIEARKITEKYQEWLKIQKNRVKIEIIPLLKELPTSEK